MNRQQYTVYTYTFFFVEKIKTSPDTNNKRGSANSMIISNDIIMLTLSVSLIP